MSIGAVDIGLTFTRLHPLKPLVGNVSVVAATALLIPGTPRSATTDSTGSLELPARWARHRVG